MERRNKKTKSVGNGEGSLFYSEKLKCWVYQYYDTQNKRQIMRQKKKESKKDFNARVTEVKNSLNNGTYINKSNESLYTILNNYIENNYKTGIIGARTYKRNNDTLKLLQKCCKSFIDKPIQNVSLNEVKKALPNLLEIEYIDTKTKKKVSKIYSQNVIDKLFMFLNKGFKIAFSERITNYNIMDNESIKKPKSKKVMAKVEALTVAEQKQLITILEKIEHKYKHIILVALYTGMRIRRNTCPYS